eukprot:m.176292 g.176292  ORF g.176292 m.176292 type:complete len:360 (+) comp13528_c0_seq10:107-1186(+)
MSLSHCVATNDPIACQHLDKALRLLLQYKPKKPRQFLSLYFDHVVEGIPAVQRAYKLILWGVDSPECDVDSTIAESYLLLSVNQKYTHDRSFGSLQMRRKQIGGGGKKRRKSRVSLSKTLDLSESFERVVSNSMLKFPTLSELDASILAAGADMSGCDGVQGIYFMQLIGMLTCDFSPHVSAALSEHFFKRDKAFVPWSHFHQAVKGCLSYSRYLSAARGLFAELDPLCTGYAHMEVCQTIINEITTSSEKGWNKTRAVIAKYREGENRRQNTTSGESDHNIKEEEEQYVSLADFLRSMSALFIYRLFSLTEKPLNKKLSLTETKVVQPLTYLFNKFILITLSQFFFDCEYFFPFNNNR